MLTALLAPLAVVAGWAHGLVSDTDRYVETVAPLASDPAVQGAVADRTTTEIVSRLGTRRHTDAVERLVHNQVVALVYADAFQEIWEQVNREAHTQLVTVLTGEGNESLSVDDNAVRLDLAPVIDAVKQRLVDRGLRAAQRLPTMHVQLTIVESDDVGKAQRAFRLLDTVSTWLPILALLCLGGAVLAGRSRRRTLIAAALALVLSMLLLGLALHVGRGIYLDAVPADQLPADAAAAVFDILVRFLRHGIGVVVVVSLVVAALTWVSGVRTGSRRATSSR